jgi:hypothetical protein
MDTSVQSGNAGGTELGRSRVIHFFPDNYEPLNYCRGCGNDFTGVAYFDRHRVGTHEYDWAPNKPDGRRCMSEGEMLEAGLTKVQIGDSSKYDKRLLSGVSLWWDSDDAERIRRAHDTVDS